MKLLLGAAAAAAVALVLAVPALADQTYNDSTGELAGEADISTVTVANDPVAGNVTFTVTTNLTALDDNTVYGVLIDSDSNVTTGVDGFDYLVGMTDQGAVTVNLATQATVPEAQSSFSNGVWTITVPATDIGSPKVFNFGVFTDVGPDPNNPIEDDAPDNGVWTYTMTQPTPPPPPPPPPVKVTVRSVGVASSTTAVHGKTFRVTGLKVNLSNSTVVKATSVKCSATLGGKHLAGTGAGGCTFRLPATAKGKKLSVKVTGKYKSTALAKTVSFKVK